MAKPTPYAVFHAIEGGKHAYLRVNQPLELPEAATGACAYDMLKKDTPGLEFQDLYTNAEPCAKADFDEAVSERLENAGTVSGAFEIDFDRSEFSALHIMDGWKTFLIDNDADYNADKRVRKALG